MKKYLYQDLYELEEKHWWHISKRKLVIEFINKFKPSINPKILDLGCGSGKNVEVLDKIGKAWGIDKSREAIMFCKKRGLKRIKLGEGENIPFKSQNFDVVTLLDVLEHVQEKPTLEEISRVLNKSGILIINVPAFNWLWSQWDEVLQHKRRYTRKMLEKALSENGFKIVKISYWLPYLIIPVILIRFVKSKIFKTNYPSDFKLSSPIINWFFQKISYIERQIVARYYIPFGTSLICVAVKK
ncbi:hypothetical protein A2714_04155 [Candidatus Woesebacteria bacterium RIFCSPHIGHO2_01_FULL_38_9]|uniref:Methyltransferase type 11 domain-containing protein n=2 Tax=Candidatus Woeseibacteriota TaxID=1752722 RepID=A0A1F7Y3I0_9BACT|nr:MAG: hypothetical protein A2714_04155 [Candidatus Woesebacteria bacterium RIFCSPHIGHO2_01_FULL_38_9]OGM60572.1 MAG: hypothetical protein A3A75_03545 [Candidatus Woesebacteria bacterium RIFCSPLOWO2_01_FULL_39_10]